MRSLAIGLIIAGTSVVVASPFVAGAADETECATSSFQWNGDRLLVPWDNTVNTGVFVPAAAVGETMSITSASYTAYDLYADDQVPSRADANQQNEKVGITVGGTQVGGLSVDLPDAPPAAPTDRFSGNVSGFFPGASGVAITGGEIVVRHAWLYGFDESPNSIRVSQIIVNVQRCIEVPPTDPPATDPPASSTTAVIVTTTTTAGATTTTAPIAPTTTATGQGGPTPTPAPTTTAAATTTVVGQGGPAPTAAPTTVRTGGLPATGSGTTVPLLLGFLAATTGVTLLVVRRRSSNA